MQTDLRTDGILDSESSGSALVNGAHEVSLATVREKLEQRYASSGVTVTIPPFEPHLQSFIDNAPYEFTGGIKYPSDGTRPNVLALDATSFTGPSPAGGYGFVAELPPSTELVIRMTLISGDVWAYAIGGVDWKVTPWDGGEQTFTALRNGRVDLPSFHLDGSGSATIDYFEYGSATPTRTKQISWSP